MGVISTFNEIKRLHMLRFRLVQFIFTLLVSLTGSQSIQAQDGPTEAGIRQLMHEGKAVGLSVAVVKKGKLIYNRSFGMKSIEDNQPMTNDCLFRIASISKSFSAASIMQLVEARKLSLDMDVSDILGFRVRNPKYPEVVITLRLMMSHLSSINDSQGYFTLDAINPDKNPDWAKCYNAYAPGKGYQYCNLNYNMLGAVIEKVSGERFDRYVKKKVLDPLGLYGGYYVEELDKSKFATLYAYDSASAKFIASPGAYQQRAEVIAAYQMGESTPVFSPTGGMKISAVDLAKYMVMHMRYGKNGKRIISKKSAKAMQTPLSDDEGYGFALEVTEKMIPGMKLTGHTGVAYGLYSAMFFDPQEQFGIVVITNGCDPQYDNGYNAFIRKMVNHLYKEKIRPSGAL
jgi:CubicO group peptidase (beta-lactamase class C family)